MDTAKLAALLKQRQWYTTYYKLKYYRPFGYQIRFHHAEGKGGGLATDRALIAANKIGKCVTNQTLIETLSGPLPIGEVFGKRLHVMAWDGEKKVPRPVLMWVKKPAEECYRVTMADGRWAEFPAGHLILTSSGYREVGTLLPSLPGSSSAFGRLARALSVRHWWRTALDSLGCYLTDCRLRDGQPLQVSEGVQVFAPLPNDAPRHSGRLWHWGEWANRGMRSLSDRCAHLSTSCDAFRSWGQSALSRARAWLLVAPRLIYCNRGDWRSRLAEHLQHKGAEARFRRLGSFASQALTIDGNKIIRVERVGKKALFDMKVAEFHNYCAAGLVHHNTYCAAMEVAMHATGIYPDWWEGHRFPHRVEILCGTESNELTRDVLQKELFGDPEDKETVGTGTVPRELLGKITRKAGVPNAYDSVMVKHVKGGYSRIFFRAYEQGPKKHQGFHIHVGWLDEEPPRDIKSQYKRATLNTRGILIHTFTPESGMTEVCNEYINHPKLGMAYVNATWDDCPLFDDPTYKAQVLEQFPEHEREMRSKGIPQMGSGLVFITPDEEIACPPFEIPRHWPRIKGIDFGIDHPFAGVAMAFDPDTEVAYLYWCHRKTRQTIADHAAAINSFDEWIPVIWPHDGFKQDAQSGKPLADIYREPPYNINMLPFCFSNPAPPGKKEGQGGQGVEVGLLALDEAMKNGKFKVFSHLSDWFEEKRMYHRMDGLVVKERDDLMSATRYAFMSRRFASIEVTPVRRKVNHKSMRNW